MGARRSRLRFRTLGDQTLVCVTERSRMQTRIARRKIADILRLDTGCKRAHRRRTRPCAILVNDNINLSLPRGSDLRDHAIRNRRKHRKNNLQGRSVTQAAI